MSGLLARRHALVTGGGRGIGAGIASALLAHDARVTLLGRDRARLEATAASLGADVAIVVADVADRQQVAVAFREAREVHGEIEILVNNAGQATTAPLHNTDEAMFEQMIAVNLTGTTTASMRHCRRC